MNNDLLTLINFSIGYSNKILIDSINAEIKQGEVICIMGPNGAGKTCLLKSILQMISSLGGTTMFLNQNLINFSKVELAQKIAIVLTEKISIEFLTVRELVAFGRSPYLNRHGQLSHADELVIDEALQLLNIENLQNKFIDELSDGQKQKAFIARALAQTPQLLLMDEPTTYLDISTRQELVKLLKKIAKDKNISVLISTHDYEFSAKISSRVWFINNQNNLAVKNIADVKNLFSISE